jgi:hypothetical protein
MNSFDEYINEQFKKHCPDAAKFLNSINPIAKKHAKEDRFFFTVGMLVRNDFSDDEVIEWDLAVAGVLCPNCPDYDPDDPCDMDPAECEFCKNLEGAFIESIINGDKRNE